MLQLHLITVHVCKKNSVLPLIKSKNYTFVEKSSTYHPPYATSRCLKHDDRVPFFAKAIVPNVFKGHPNTPFRLKFLDKHE